MKSLILHEDEHLLVVNKPAGWNTHSPSPYAGEGVYEWLRHREPRWAGLAIMHRLDKATSGLLVFAKTPEACRSLTRQFAEREVTKTYRLATDASVAQGCLTVRLALRREGEKHVAVAPGAGGESAETEFEVLGRERGLTFLRAWPVTGRTHQIRVHAASAGFPIVGDFLYGGRPESRLWLHAESILFHHPLTGAELRFDAPADFGVENRIALREAVVNSTETTAFRVLNGGVEAASLLPSIAERTGFCVDRFGPCLIAQSLGELTASQIGLLRRMMVEQGLSSALHRPARHDIRSKRPDDVSPRQVAGEPVPDQFVIRENGVCFEIRVGEGYSVGLFLDQRDNRRRLRVNHVAAGFPVATAGLAGAQVLNAFAYTCGFSVCAALAGARTTSLDLSRKYLDWGRRNFELNGLDASQHDFIYGDAFDWLHRLTRKGRRFDVVMLDPPTFSTSKPGGVFRAEKDFGRLVCAAAPLVRPGGVLFASTNAAQFDAETFVGTMRSALTACCRIAALEHYSPQPPDFPISRDEPAYLKTIWMRLS